MTTQTKIRGKFYPIQIEEWLESIKQLTFSEIKILYYLRITDPYNKGINITPAQIAKDLSTEEAGMHRSTVSRALKSLESKGFLETELLQVYIKVNPKGFLSKEKTADVATTKLNCNQTTPVVPSQPDVLPRNIECGQTTECATRQQASPETKTKHGFQKSKTYIDFKDSLSESERESFFIFVRKQIQNFNQPINDLEAWLASQTKARQNRWEVYYQKFREEKNSSFANSDRSSTISEAKQKAIARYQEFLKRQNKQLEQHLEPNTDVKIEREIDRSRHDHQRSINSLESQSKPVAKPLSQKTAQGCETLRNWSIDRDFAGKTVRGGLV
ncbi:MarR family transcriptional regulator [Pleurocapsa sp. FMAR1]|uniref:MarR family transcriptional regulator n=1 Tax=Pleurocapsa sp. FMAR1 TaxID=3040204 RepID=UPI0029C8214A|nr:helix-turn-helix domain-containing protein [Pleurocapsa sp. FMAR1]